MTIGSIQQGPRRTNFNAVAALRAIQPTAIGSDYRVRTTIAGFDRVFAHPLVADARATLAENAALWIVSDHRRQIFFGMVILLFREALFEIAPIKRQLLQLALAATIAYGTVERMIRQQKLEHRSLRLFNLFALRGYDHAIRANDRAGRLQLRHFLDPHQTHATRSLQSKIGVIAE